MTNSNSCLYHKTRLWVRCSYSSLNTIVTYIRACWIRNRCLKLKILCYVEMRCFTSFGCRSLLFLERSKDHLSRFVIKSPRNTLMWSRRIIHCSYNIFLKFQLTELIAIWFFIFDCEKKLSTKSSLCVASSIIFIRWFIKAVYSCNQSSAEVNSEFRYGRLELFWITFMYTLGSKPLGLVSE